MQVQAVELGVGPREVNELEDAQCGLVRLGGHDAFDAVVGEDHDLARLDVTDERGADDVECAGFRGEDGMPVEVAEHERANAVGIAEADQLLLVHHDRGEGADDAADGLFDAIDERAVVLADECGDDLGVGGRLELESTRFELVTQLGRIREVAVVRERQRSTLTVADDRLGVLPARRARRGVARVADGGDALERLERGLVEDLRDEAELTDRLDVAAVGDGDARALLPAMLQGVEREVREARDVAVRRADTEDAAHG